MNINEMFKEFALENLNLLPLPLSKNRVVILDDLSSLSDLLFRFINFEVEEQSLKRIRSNFENDFEKIYNLDKKELPGAIEGLATNFESFLKKIALIKFNNSDVWNGDGCYKGVKKCMLFELLEGKASKLDSKSPGEEFKNFPSPLVSKVGTSKGILDFVRSELRNSVHSANVYSRTQLIQYSNLVLGAYLIAINDNIQFFRKKFFPEFSYLESIVANKELNSLNDYYIDIYGKEESFDFDNIAIEQLNGQQLIESLNQIFDDEFVGKGNEGNEIEENEIEEVARVDSVVNISRDTNRFIIIGEPGSGKTTCLQKILLENAKGMLNGAINNRLPVYIKASSYSSVKNFGYLISEEIEFMPFEHLNSKHKLLILIDGLNEIEDKLKRTALADLKELLSNYPNIDFIISSRKFGFVNSFSLNVFELKKLNDTQINQLVLIVLKKENGEKLWVQLNKNRQLLILAGNPLMLMMIIKVSSLTNNEIPPNKGMLYKLFNDAILAREQRFYNTDIETKKDILSYIAFWMRSRGIFKAIKKVQAKEIVKEKLAELDRSLGVNEVLNELSDNNFFIEKAEDLEFYHETQQEYFVALELQNLFFKNKALEFDYSDSKWFEPILICSDLFTNDEDRMKFFELIFIGEKKLIPKHIKDFDSTDVNQEFFVACKVAYNLKEIHPSLFNRAETFLSNYLTIWHYRKADNVEIIDFESIIKAVASLSDEFIFRNFFYDLRNLEYWFYNSEIDNRSANNNSFEEINQKLNNYAKAFVDNLNDFTLLYKILIEKKSFFTHIHAVSRSIYYNFKSFFKYLFNNSPTSELIQAFKETKQSQLLFEIGKVDLDFFIDNYFITESATEYEFFEFIIRYHVRNQRGIDFLTLSLENPKIETSVRLSILNNLIVRREYLHVIFKSLKELLTKRDVLIFLDETKMLLNKYPIDILKSFGLDVIFTNPIIEKIDISLKFINETNDQLIFESRNNRIDSKQILNSLNNIYYTDKHVSFVPTLVNNSDTFTNVIVVTASKEIIKHCFEKYNGGGAFTIHCIDFRRHSVTKQFQFNELYLVQHTGQLLIGVDAITSINIKGILIKFRNIKLLIGQEFRFSIKELSKYRGSFFLKCNKACFDQTRSFTNFQIYNVKINFLKPFEYHRDLVSSNSAFILNIQTQINKPEVVKFVRLIGLTYLFWNNLQDLNLGVVVAIYEEKYKILLLDKNEIIVGVFIKSKPFEDITINDVVLIEENLNISLINSSLNIDKYFVKSQIVSISSDISEGFIAGIGEGKDYYFLSQYCNFSPRAGLLVKFIAGINFTKNNSSRPMAYCIRQIGNKRKIAKVLEIKSNNDFKCEELFLLDIDTKEKLFSRVYSTRKIVNFNGQISIGDLFSYYVPDKFRGTNRVVLSASENLIKNS